MQWEGREESSNVDDRRGMGGIPGGGLAVGGIGGVLLLVVASFIGIDPNKLGGLIGANNKAAPGEVRKASPEEEKMAKFTKIVFRDTETVWEKLFADMGKRYKNPTLVLFTDRVDSACGSADAAVGPFYCPGDSKVYIDLSFYVLMEKKLAAGGEFPRAYVVAHEVGHHVQRLLGYADIVDNARRTQGKTEQNRMSVRLELQADYLAGVWAHYMQDKYKLTDKDIADAINAAHAIGDDTLSHGQVRPDSFTHGTSKQRMYWFKEGYTTGDVNKARALFDLDYNRL